MPLLSSDVDDLVQEVAPLEGAKLHATIAYAMTALYGMYLGTEGKDPSKHSITEEFKRITQSMQQIRAVEAVLTNPAGAAGTETKTASTSSPVDGRDKTMSDVPVKKEKTGGKSAAAIAAANAVAGSGSGRNDDRLRVDAAAAKRFVTAALGGVGAKAEKGDVAAAAAAADAAAAEGAKKEDEQDAGGKKVEVVASGAVNMTDAADQGKKDKKRKKDKK